MYECPRRVEIAASRVTPALGSGGHWAALRCYRREDLVAKIAPVSEMLPGPVRSGAEAGCVVWGFSMVGVSWNDKPSVESGGDCRSSRIGSRVEAAMGRVAEKSEVAGLRAASVALPARDETDVAWAIAQGIANRKAGSVCADYKGFLARYDLVHTRYTLNRIWDAYRKSAGGSRGKRKRRGRQAAGAVQNRQGAEGDSSPARTDPSRRVRRSGLTPAEWDAKFNASPLMQQVNPSDTLSDAWR
jgi:hypothetical protein